MRTGLLTDVHRCEAPPLAPGAAADRRQAADAKSTAPSLIPRGRALFWQGDRQAQRIEIVQGVVRAVRLLENGNRQILAFYWPGDTVTPIPWCQQYTAEAVTNCRVLRTTAPHVCAADSPCAARQVLAETLTLVLRMSQKNSGARIAWLLLRIRRHLPIDPRRPNAFQLLLPRADMADYVGTSLETVCRTLAEFKARKLIDLPNRKTIRFLDVPALSRVAQDD